MRAVVQRVSRASVSIEDEKVGEINRGLVVLLGIGLEDNEGDARYLADKIVNLRIFEDDGGKFNLSARDLGGEILVISNFTLFGDCRKGRRPNFTSAAPPREANLLYEKFISIISEYGLKIATGRFQAMMKVEIINDGPVTILLDSKREF